jgi:precorrin-4 methylase
MARNRSVKPPIKISFGGGGDSAGLPIKISPVCGDSPMVPDKDQAQGTLETVGERLHLANTSRTRLIIFTAVRKTPRGQNGGAIT